MFDISTKKYPNSIDFTVTIKEVVYTFEYKRSDLILKTKEEISSKVKLDLSANVISRYIFFKILNHMNSAIREYLKSEI